MVSSALPPTTAAAAPMPSQAKKGKVVSSFVKSRSSSIVKQAGKSFKGVGSSISERRISMPASIGKRGKSTTSSGGTTKDEEVEFRDVGGGGGGSGTINEGRAAPQSLGAAVEERECTDGGAEQQSRESVTAETSNDLLGDASLLLLMPPLDVPPPTPPTSQSSIQVAPPLTPGSTSRSSEGGGRRRKLLNRAKSLPKKLQVGGGHRSSQSVMASPEVASDLARLSVGGSSPRPLSSSMTSAQSQFSAAAAANTSGGASTTASASIILHPANASAATAVASAIASSNNPNSNTTRDEAPRVTVIEPLPLAPPEKMRQPRSYSVAAGSGAGSGGIGFGSFLPNPGGTSGTTSKRSGAEKLFRSLRGKDELAEAAAAVGLDKDIGLKLALPDKLDIMCGRATPPPPGSTAASGQDGACGADGRDDQEDPYANPFACSTPNSSPRKKILIVPGSQEDRDAPGRTPLSAIRKKLTIPTLANLTASTPTSASPAASSGAGGMDDRSIHSASSRGSRGSRRSYTHSGDGSLSIAKPTDDRPVQAASDPVMDEIVIRTSELEPSVHQITLPAAMDLLLCARVCSLLEGYDRLLRHQAAKGRRWFDFAELVGAERHELEEAYLRALGHHKEADEQAKRQAIAGSIARMGASTSIQVPSSSGIGNSGNPFGAGGGAAVAATLGTATPATGVSASTTMEEVSVLGDTVTDEGSRFTDPKNLPHPSILKSLLDCGDDIKVEGYFTETLGEEDEGLSIPALEHGERTIFPEDYGEKSSAVTVSVFSSQQHRQFIVCYKGTAEQQAKPVKSHVRQKDANGEPSVLHPTHAVLVNPTFRDCYFTNALEKKVFTLLDKLTSANPFCDVVFCGHSFGGALGIIGATRYSALFPMMTVHCHTFGTPKVGGTTFRHFANSLPNLKLMRIENGADYYPHFPLGDKWDHAGHTIVISPPQTDITTAAKDKIAKVKSGTNPIGAASFIGKNRIPVLAYKFDKRAVGDHQPSIMPYVPSNIKNPSSKVLDPLARTKKERGKADHEMNSYLLGIERFTHLGQTWVTDYVGEEGGGIVRGGSDTDYEERYLV